MLFDFHMFQKIVERCYEPGPYSLEEVLDVFKTYFLCYEEKFGRPHPNIRAEQIRKIIRKMPYMEKNGEQLFLDEVPGDIFPCVYPYIIRRHFMTKYSGCDYGINHFFSGRIRELRERDEERLGERYGESVTA